MAEFYVFICRIAFENYRGTPYENEMMYLKLEHTIPIFLDYLNLTPTFLFEEQFEYKPPVKKARGRKAKVVKVKDSSSDESTEEEEEEESSSEEDLAECVVLQEGQFKLQLSFI